MVEITDMLTCSMRHDNDDETSLSGKNCITATGAVVISYKYSA